MGAPFDPAGFYDAPATAPEPAPPDGSADAVAAQFYREAPPPSEGASSADAADALYGDPAVIAASYAPQLADALDDLRDRAGWTDEERETVARNAAVAFADAGVSPDVAATLFARVARHVAEPADDATVAAWETETRRALRDRYGADDADRRLATAREFVANRPELASLLNRTGVGSHPDLVLALAENARDLRVVPRGPAPEESP